MPTTLTLNDVPDLVYARLQRAAALHQRSVHDEALVCLEAMLPPTKVSAVERLQRARALRAELAPALFAASEITLLKEQGRP